MRPPAAPPVPAGWLDREMTRLFEFGRLFPHPLGGAAWLGPDGTPDLDKPVHTWITARMTHVYSLADLLGVPGAGSLADAGLAGLTGVLHDARHGGWYPSVSAAGQPAAGQPAAGKSCYDHAFVVLAASSAAIAGRPGARDLLATALDTLLTRFWDDDHGMFIDRWDTEWLHADDYRGLNANMHAVEAMLAAYDATADPDCLRRALTITANAVRWARDGGWRMPEHFDAAWRPRLDHHRDRPLDPFKPFGATVGHALEWSRLVLHLEAALGTGADDWMLPAAAALFDRAAADGWAVDGAPGFVYTTDWDGRPVSRQRMHWVAAEAVGAAAVLHARTGDDRYQVRYARWWDYIRHHVVDREHGSWHHELDSGNQPAASTWPGKPDLYHAVQATLIPRAPLAPGLAAACAAGAIR
ncbi:AGE family epimerase/isomerase [Actinoplanes sp. NPDC051494]|uniref:AGE family epimerase/isomerase n=1 Tax=Actinoplanes sp. NPDC051494 TaxID=3363907 RepID=UPI0037AF6AB9